MGKGEVLMPLKDTLASIGNKLVEKTQAYLDERKEIKAAVKEGYEEEKAIVKAERIEKAKEKGRNKARGVRPNAGEAPKLYVSFGGGVGDEADKQTLGAVVHMKPNPNEDNDWIGGKLDGYTTAICGTCVPDSKIILEYSNNESGVTCQHCRKHILNSARKDALVKFGMQD